MESLWSQPTLPYLTMRNNLFCKKEESSREINKGKLNKVCTLYVSGMR